ncbi:hypothetical protein XELAEV_18000705mg [Xenopus laevis]|uniref:Uncharacterized protein n=1 Tax=Xenopus laevis TaxID=8355 RepID=A0A974BPK2_XENLA|nr:hypothetical protein XELAEV_18000705mg [Xenopus laevis]
MIVSLFSLPVCGCLTLGPHLSFVRAVSVCTQGCDGGIWLMRATFRYQGNLSVSDPQPTACLSLGGCSVAFHPTPGTESGKCHWGAVQGKVKGGPGYRRLKIVTLFNVEQQLPQRHRLRLSCKCVCSGCECSGCECSGCECSGSECSGCECSGCECSGCECSGSECSGCECSGSECCSCECSGCKCSGSECSGSDCSGSECSGSECSGS